jgi:hypothetical protein
MKEPHPFNFDTFATAINVHGQNAGSRAGRAFLWQIGASTDLNTLIPASARTVLIPANGIDDSRQQRGDAARDVVGAPVALDRATQLPMHVMP